MAFIHNVEISWDALLNAFTNGPGDHTYFLDKMTGEIFFVSTAAENDEFWSHIETNQERFLEIPHFDLRIEKQIMADFVNGIQDVNLRKLMADYQSGSRPYGRLDDILEFFPEDQERLMELKDAFLSRRMKSWFEENNLVTVEPASMGVKSL